MAFKRESRRADEQVWKQCLECGDRFEAGRHGYQVNWCSPSCEHATLRRQRDAVENTWLRAGWFLR